MNMKTHLWEFQKEAWKMDSISNKSLWMATQIQTLILAEDQLKLLEKIHHIFQKINFKKTVRDWFTSLPQDDYRFEENQHIMKFCEQHNINIYDLLELQKISLKYPTPKINTKVKTTKAITKNILLFRETYQPLIEQWFEIKSIKNILYYYKWIAVEDVLNILNKLEYNQVQINHLNTLFKRRKRIKRRQGWDEINRARNDWENIPEHRKFFTEMFARSTEGKSFYQHIR